MKLIIHLLVGGASVISGSVSDGEVEMAKKVPGEEVDGDVFSDSLGNITPMVDIEVSNEVVECDSLATREVKVEDGVASPDIEVFIEDDDDVGSVEDADDEDIILEFVDE